MFKPEKATVFTAVYDVLYILEHAQLEIGIKVSTLLKIYFSKHYTSINLTNVNTETLQWPRSSIRK